MLMIINYLILALSVALPLTVLIRIGTALHTFRRRLLVQKNHHASLPTVSVCIPARNESNAMTQCLERVIASDYPKLEVIVFDDQSGDNTSFLIKSFAHAGVRFIEGSPLPEGWLGKNFAQHNLFRESSGEYILYLDVDTHITPHTISTLITQAATEDTTMLSVLPSRNDGLRMSVLFATLRYFWTLIFHGKNQPAVASSLWLISRQYLEENMNGFELIKNITEPEVRIAERLMSANKYRFYLNDAQLGVSYEKKWRSQCETAIRLLFPFVGGTTLKFAVAMGALLILLYPVVICSISIIRSDYSHITLIALLALCLFLVSYALYISATWRKGMILGLIILPLVIIQEMVLLVISMYKYKTKTVTWKGRLIHSSAKVSQTM